MNTNTKILVGILAVALVALGIIVGGNTNLLKGSIITKGTNRPTETSKPIFLRLYERGGMEASKIILDNPIRETFINLNKISDVQDPAKVGLDIQTETNYQYLVLGLNESQDIDFGRTLINIKLTQLKASDGYVVLSLVRK